MNATLPGTRSLPEQGTPGNWFQTGAGQMLLATFYFALMNIFIKAVTHLPVMEIVLFRCGISALLCMADMRIKKVSWRGSNPRLLVLRGVFGTTGLFLYFMTIANMPLGTAVTIQYLAPIFTTLLAWVVLHERVKPMMLLFFLISFSGVFVIKGFDHTLSVPVLLIGLGAAVASALAYITIRYIKQGEHPLVVVFHFQAIGALTGLAFSLFRFETPQGIEWVYLLLIGVFTQLGQMHMTRSFQRDNVANVTIINYTGVFYATLSGWLLFHESYSGATLAGMALVIAGVVLSVLFRK